MGKFALLFLLTLVVAFAYLRVFSKRERKATWKGLRSLVVPALIAVAVFTAAVFLSINPAMKVI